MTRCPYEFFENLLYILPASNMIVSDLGRFGPGHFGLGRFGQFLGWVVWVLVGGPFPPIFEVSLFGPGSFRPKSIETIKG